MKKVLLINEGASDNLGDQAIRFTLEKLIENNDYEIEFIDFTRLKENVGNLDEISENSFRSKKMLKRMLPQFIMIILRRILWITINFNKIKNIAKNKEYDLLIIGGGQLILSNTLFPIAMFSWINIFKKFSKVKVVLVGVGAGKSFNRIDKFLYSSSLKKVDEIYIRDTESIITVKREFNLLSNYMPDVVFYISKIIKNNTRKKNSVLVGIVDYDIYKRYNPNGKSEKEYMSCLKNEILNLLDKGKKINLFYTSSEDIPQTIKLKRMLKNENNIDLKIRKINNLNELISNISKTELIISGRMHPLIIGLAYNCDIKPVIISEKIRIFNNDYIKKSLNIEKIQDSIDLVIKKILLI